MGYFEERSEKMEVSKEFDKNMILYGPPGTGKTYNTAIYAVKICEPEFDCSDYDIVMAKYNQLKAEKRISFTTFHQSYGYEEFIEGIKPILDETGGDIGYTIEAGAFKKFCEIARTPSNIKVNHNASIYFMRLNRHGETTKEICFNNSEILVDTKVDDDWIRDRFVKELRMGDYVISYSGKSSYIDAIGVVEGEAEFDSQKENFQWSRKMHWYIFDKPVDVKPINNDTELPNYSMTKMNHMKLSDLVKLLPDTDAEMKPYVFIIDEINRGNISKIFGELITLIEGTKREGENEAASAVLPYSGESFSVPTNIYILGTMNTADRSIALMDTALRRRFQFVEMMPNSDVLRSMNADRIMSDGLTLDVAEMLDTINARIEYLFDREHTIGHAFFTGLKNEPTIEKLGAIFKKSVIPLLQEYFYEDYGKIMMILGDNGKTIDNEKFILEEETRPNIIFRGDTSEIDIPEHTYKIQDKAFENIRSYIGIKG